MHLLLLRDHRPLMLFVHLRSTFHRKRRGSIAVLAAQFAACHEKDYSVRILRWALFILFLTGCTATTFALGLSSLTSSLVSVLVPFIPLRSQPTLFQR